MEAHAGNLYCLVRRQRIQKNPILGRQYRPGVGPGGLEQIIAILAGLRAGILRRSPPNGPVVPPANQVRGRGPDRVQTTLRVRAITDDITQAKHGIGLNFGLLQG